MEKHIQGCCVQVFICTWLTLWPGRWPWHWCSLEWLWPRSRVCHWWRPASTPGSPCEGAGPSESRPNRVSPTWVWEPPACSIYRCEREKLTMTTWRLRQDQTREQDALDVLWNAQVCVNISLCRKQSKMRINKVANRCCPSKIWCPNLLFQEMEKRCSFLNDSTLCD